jgi:hypothetical protein
LHACTFVLWNESSHGYLCAAWGEI